MKSGLKNKWFTLLLTVLLVILLIAGTALIASGIWDREEPMVPLSYITDELQPGLNSAVDEAIDNRLATIDQELDANLAKYQEIVDQKFNSDQEFANNVAEAAAKKIQETTGGGYRQVTLADGEKVTLSQGTEVLLRSGSATFSGSTENSLVDLSAGSVLDDMQQLTENHLYLAYAGGCEIVASGDVEIFVSGEYQ